MPATVFVPKFTRLWRSIGAITAHNDKVSPKGNASPQRGAKTSTKEGNLCDTAPVFTPHYMSPQLGPLPAF